MDIVRDVLDKAVVDRNGREMGRVDGILLEVGDDGRPRVKTFLIGPGVLGSRLHPMFGRFVSSLERGLGIDRDRPSRINIADVDQIGDKIRLRLTIGETAVGALEQLLARWIGKIPGSR